MLIEKVWITKYALTRGILEAFNAEMPSPNKHHILVRCGKISRWFYGRDWHTSEAMAVLRAIEMLSARRRRIALELDKLTRTELAYNNGTYLVNPFGIDKEPEGE